MKNVTLVKAAAALALAAGVGCVAAGAVETIIKARDEACQGVAVMGVQVMRSRQNQVAAPAVLDVIAQHDSNGELLRVGRVLVEEAYARPQEPTAGDRRDAARVFGLRAYEVCLGML